MRLIIFLLFEILAAFVAAVPVVVSSRLSDASAQAFSSNLNNTRSVEFRILASSKDEPSFQPRDEAVVDTPELKDDNVTASNEPHNRSTRNRLRDLLSIIPRASKSPSKGSGGGGGGGGKSPTQRPAPARQPSSRTPAPARQASSRTPSGSGSGSRAPTTRPPTKGQVSTKSQTQTQPQSKSMNMKNPTKAELDAADKKFNRKGLPENQRKYLDNLDRQKAGDCGKGCGDNINSFRSSLSKQQKEQLKNPPAKGPSRADRGQDNTKKDDQNHDFNHLRMMREPIGKNGEAQLNSWHSVEHQNSVNSKASKASKASKDSQASKNSQASNGGG
ncbi:hypothetical protein C8035_v008309 [Colletotrichum spinosum]|uniref:Uncharacterized protein n=1 Tax=Colletotrichum spinosum TaxID=1347390 RepID=A0A4R8QHL9_9PEZI|nr:hypothetical protein C8035_v008309 [Colletotrichum spinosum]